MTYEVIIGKTGDRAEADTLAGALLAASTMVREYADEQQTQGARRAARESVLIVRDGRYDGLATVIAQQGQT